MKVYDFFSGCGGASLGFQKSGMSVVLGLDKDKDAVETFSKSFPNSKAFQCDIRDMQPSDIEQYFDRNELSLFCACAPCQPFSKIKRREEADNRIQLLLEFSRFVKYFTPDFIFLENVPGVQSRFSDGPLDSFTHILSELGYFYKFNVVDARNYGVPQKRARLVLIASKNRDIDFPNPTNGPKIKDFSTVREWIDNTPEILAGGAHPSDPMHRSAKLSETNLTRISMTPAQKGRESWPEELKLACHTAHSGHTDVYGRMHWDKPASALTTKCISLSNGRFGHPEQNRAISLREAALIQTFPSEFIAYGTQTSIARQIGNAVPPLLAQKFGENFINYSK